MTQARILVLLGPALVSYLLLDFSARGDHLDWLGWALAILALACSAAPYGVRSWTDTEGAKRTAALGVCAAVIITTMANQGLDTQLLLMLRVLAEATAAVLVINLALRVPDTPARFDLRGWVAQVPQALGVVVALFGMVAYLPPFRWGDDFILLPALYHYATPTFLLAMVSIASVLRVARWRLGSSPDALAANSWGLLGLLPLLVVGWGGALLMAEGIIGFDDSVTRAAVSLGLFMVVWGHVTLVDPRQRVIAGSRIRSVLTFAIGLGLVGGGLHYYEEWLAERVSAWASLLPVAAVAVFCVARLVRPLVQRGLAPNGGHLLQALVEIRESWRSVEAIGEVAAQVLVPLRRAAAGSDARPLLYTLTPDSEFRIDAGGAPMRRDVSPHPALLARLRAEPQEIIVSQSLGRGVVREPEIRTAVAELERLGALCVVPLRREGQLEGALVVPRGRRLRSVSLEETHVLHELAERLADFVGPWTACARAQSREGVLVSSRDTAMADFEESQEEVSRLRAEMNLMRSGRAASRRRTSSVAYSRAMRRFEGALRRSAAEDAPLCLIAEGGVAVDRHAMTVHRASRHALGPLVTIDCASASSDDGLLELLGNADAENPRSGWLRLASDGTLLLADVPALPKAAQRALAEALATREVRPVGGGAAYPLRARIIVTARRPLEELEQSGGVAASLVKRLQPTRVLVPPLRDRLEDVPSLALIAIDRAVRVLGRQALGLSEAALSALTRYRWPGNERELQHVIERAVTVASSDKIEVSDLPPLHYVAGSVPHESFSEMERRVIEQALVKTEGNQAAAARLLGLRPSTLSDKIRRQGLSVVRRRKGRSGGGTGDAA